MASGVKLALFHASMATPAKPISNPTARDPVGRSLSHSQAMNAPNKGVVAFKIDDKPVLIDNKAKLKQAKGMAEFKMPTKNVSFQCWRRLGPWPRSKTIGSKNRAAIATRRPDVAKTPSSFAPKRMKRNDAPQIAASNTNSGNHPFEGALTGCVPVAAVRFCGVAHRHSLSKRHCCPPRGGRAR